MTTGGDSGLRTSACDVPSGVKMSIALGTVVGSTAQIGLAAAIASGVHTPNWKSWAWAWNLGPEP